MLVAILFLSLGTYAQATFLQTASNPTGAIVNASVDTMNYTLSGTYTLVTIQPIITKLTGTAAGTSTLSYSLDGVNYVTTATTALTLTNVTKNTTVWNVASSARYWRIITGGATTVTATCTAKILAGR